LERPAQRVQADGLSLELPGGGVALSTEQMFALDEEVVSSDAGERFVGIISGTSFVRLEAAKPGSDDAIPPISAVLLTGTPELTGVDALGEAGAQSFVETMLGDETGDYARYELESSSTSRSPFGPAATASASGPRGPRGVLRIHSIVLPTGFFFLVIAAPTGESQLADKVLFQAVSTLQLG